MLASITPLGERGRQTTWTITVTAFVLGATLAAAAAGALLGWAGSLVIPASVTLDGRLAALAVLGAVAVLLDVRSARVPGPHRQVDEAWLDSYRGWVYGLGFGAQLGLGVTTVVSSAATYVAFAAALLSGGAGRGAVVLGSFGAVRGLSLLAGAYVRRPEQLMSLHAALQRWRRPVARLAVGGLSAIVALAAAGAIT